MVNAAASASPELSTIQRIPCFCAVVMSRVSFSLYAVRQTATDNQQCARLNFQHLILKLVELIIGERSARHDEAILFAAGLNVDMEILSGPVFSFDGGYGNIFVGEQSNKMLSGGATRRKMAVAVPPRWAIARATLIPPPPGSKPARYSEAYLPGRFAA